jgi:hypothetical protein
MAKPDQHLAAHRIAEISFLRVQGRSVAKCVEYARKQGWNVTYTAVWKYVSQADKAIAKQIERRQTQLIESRTQFLGSWG